MFCISLPLFYENGVLNKIIKLNANNELGCGKSKLFGLLEKKSMLFICLIKAA